MVLQIINLICAILAGLIAGVFIAFVVLKLREINSKTDSILTSKHHWSMGIYMNDIPQNEQNTAHIVSVPLKIYHRDEYLNIPVPRKGEEISGVYVSDNRFYMVGIVEDVFYNTDMDWIVVECKCIDIRKM